MQKKHTLQKVYEQTSYQTDVPQLNIRLYTLHPDLDDVLITNGCRTWAFLTAWNPGSHPMPFTENQQRNAGLAEELKPWKVMYGRGIPDHGDWTPEESFLVLGIVKEDALMLGVKWGQHAILYGELATPAQLIWCT